MRLKFLGAAQNVTGSRYLLEDDNVRVLVDCGLYQERHLRDRNWDPFPIPPKSIDAVLLTHAHLDHSGLLPKLVREGFKGSIYCTDATADISKIMLLDSAHLQEEDAKSKKKRHEKEGRTGPHPEVPLYTINDANACLSLLSPVRYEDKIQVAQGISASFHDAGHILGSSSIKVEFALNGEKRTVIFSGDVGRWDRPILRDPTIFESADYILVESTYGDRLHGDVDSIQQMLTNVVNSTRIAGGNIVIPSFTIGRAQEVLYYLNELLMEDRIPHLMVFVDSPMAIKAIEVFRRHPELFDQDMLELLSEGDSPFDFPNLKMTRTTHESKAVNYISGTAIIIAGSGMCTGGRIKYHLLNNISRSESTILFVGYQAVGTLGRHIVSGDKEIRIFGKTQPVRAKITQISGFSAHADRDELLRWLSGLQKPPRHVFVTHGEPNVARHFANLLTEKKGWKTSVPSYQDEVTLD